jgi:hypothetical protein
MGVMFVLLGAFMPAFMLIHLTWTNAALALPVLIIPLVNIPLCRRLLLADYGVQTRPMLMGSVVGLCWRTNLLWTLALLLVGLGRAFEPSLFA